MDNKRSAMPFGPPSYGQLDRVSDHCFIFRNTVNSGVIISDTGVAVVDTQINASMARRLIRAIRAVTDKPIRYAINTHYHWDHWAGNDVFAAEGAQLVCGTMTREFMGRRHLRQRAFLTGRGFHMPATDPAIPDINVEGRLDLHMGNVTLKLEHLGDAETRDATAITLVEDEVLLAGDTVMTGSFPILGQPVSYEGMGEDRCWIETLKVIQQRQPRAIVPGHGPMANLDDVAFFIELQEYFLAAVEQAVVDGLDRDQTLERIEGSIPEVYRTMATTWGTPRYAILRALKSYTGWQHFKPSAIPAADPADVEARLDGLEPAPTTFQDAARTAREGGEDALALAILEEGTRSFPTDPGIHVALADQLIESSRAHPSVLEKGDFFIKARRHLDRALELDGDHGPGLVSLGGYLCSSAYQSGDDPSEGLEMLEKALEGDLEDTLRARAAFFKGVGLRTREDEDGAVAAFRQAKELDPKNPMVAMALGERPAGMPPGMPGGRPPGAGRPRPS